MDPQFLSLMKGLNIPDNFIKFVEDKKICDAESFALMAADEKEVKSEIFPIALAANVKLDDISEQIAVKKLWIACRKHMAGSSNPAAPVQDEDVLPKEVGTDLKTHWKHIHGFVLPDSWLLSAQLQRKMWNGAHASPPSVESFLMENLRLLSQRSRASGTLVNVVPGRGISATSTEIDMIQNPMEVYTRARGWFMTLAYVSIRNVKWFDLQTAIFASDKIMELAQVTSGGIPPTLSHFIGAWAATVNYCAEQVRVTGQPLSTFVMNTGAWEHRWSWTAPSTEGRSHAGADLPRYVADDVESMRQQARHWQSMVDKQRSDVQRNKDKGNGKGNGKNKDKNGGKSFEKRGSDRRAGQGDNGHRHRDRSRRR